MLDQKLTGRAVVATLAALVTLTLPLTFPPGGGPTGVDRALADMVRTGPPAPIHRVLVAPSDGWLVVTLLLAAIAWFGWRRQWWRAATMLVVPEAAIALNTWVLKPLFDRPLHDYLAYPSGHTVHLVAVVTTVVLLCDSARVRLAVAVAGVVACGAVVVGQVGMDYHYATDVVGGAAAALALGIAGCAAAERLAGSRRPARGPGHDDSVP
ncbi:MULTISPECIES: phosphatase PAP2 family protein [Nocardia]|uniref:phosphatase PAP2 family protein n=1 Tax=Nocardia TaxID=1817 RepID=UPI000BF1FCA4|nr:MULTISPECIES: phosphatase PAP2 family protein [Nocardia]MBF6184477.1 phosphatase PAP2 family protein [Nocardia farcinica]MBF6255810.1 phosphatase PAP2 family protein [Nocardia farcinica]MBF6290414.1 phosphatase PAP2 family protein [Nocardia farcinica]MBF6310321.1 phosphatase PAP2 family protein [Nocardia farcinica]MBF6377587.1 phosphatase PAP2 family protein [Nocardia farcinica]